MAASTLEFKSSTTSTITKEEIRMAFSNGLIGISSAKGVSNTRSVNSCLKALSSLKA